MKPRPIPEDAAKKKREALELAHGARFWLKLRSSLDESRAHGIPLTEAKRRLEARLVAEGNASKKSPRRRAAH
jgi:predicted mannosyl-3-phosphoglycerate phosphatase (HAD superfamily)